MSEWVKVEDHLPKEDEIVKFLHQGYEFKGTCVHKPFPFRDPLSDQYPNWFFVGSQGGGKVTTVQVTHWMPLPKAPENK